MTILVLIKSSIRKDPLKVTFKNIRMKNLRINSLFTCLRMMKRIKLILPDLSLLAIWNFEKQIWDFRDNKMLHITKMATICILRISENLALPLFWYFVWPQKLCLDLYWSHLSSYLIQEKKNRNYFLSAGLKEEMKRQKGQKEGRKGQKGSWRRQL